MATAAPAADHQAVIDDIITLALVDLRGVVRASAEPGAVERALTQIVGDYGSVAGMVAAAWYDELRDEARATGRFIAEQADLPDQGRIAALANWGTEPILADKVDLAVSRLEGGLQRILADVDRDTITENIARDPAGTRYARHASANACAFCALMATRGEVYTSKRAAETRSIGTRYHDNCHCVAVPVWPGQTYQQPAYVNTWSRVYRDASGPGKGLNEVLADMRSIGGLR